MQLINSASMLNLILNLTSVSKRNFLIKAACAENSELNFLSQDFEDTEGENSLCYLKLLLLDHYNWIPAIFIASLVFPFCRALYHTSVSECAVRFSQ